MRDIVLYSLQAAIFALISLCAGLIGRWIWEKGRQ